MSAQKEFEKAAKLAGYSTTKGGLRKGTYLYEEVQAAWEIWQAARSEGGQEAVAWASPLPDGTEQVTKELPERIYGVVPKDYQWYVRPLVYGDTHPQSAKTGVPEGLMERIKSLLLGVGHHGIQITDEGQCYEIGETEVAEAQELYRLLNATPPPTAQRGE